MTHKPLTAILFCLLFFIHSTEGASGSNSLDELAGEYWVCGSFTAKLAKVEKVKFVKDKDALKIVGIKAWEKCRFLEKSENKLVDESHLGSLIPGEMSFKDKHGTRKVLRAEFCYDYFVFVSGSLN